jgi:enamine deaminase RidA (YjgF/YER057c/UK114 family)
MKLEPINPTQLGAPRGFSHGILAPTSGRLLFVAGQIGNRDGAVTVVPGGFVEQFEQALRNVVAVVQAAGGGPEQIARLTLFVTDREAYLGNLVEIGAAYRRVMGKWYPAMALLHITALVVAEAKVEIEATAVLP